MFKRKPITPIERRLQELHKELSGVSRDLDKVSRTGAVGGTAPKPPPFQEGPAPEAAPGNPPPPAAMAGLDADGGNLFAYAANAPAPPNTTGDLFPDLPSKSVIPARNAPPARHDHRSGREKFAHYFMAGHFQNLRPSRQESRVVRNKAIVMLVVFSILLAWLLIYLRGH